MNIRIGFVSNSSSSSFVIMTLESDFQQAMNTLSDTEKKVIRYFVQDHTKFLDNDIVVLGYLNVFDGFDFTQYNEYDEETDTTIDAYDLWDEFTEKLKDSISVSIE